MRISVVACELPHPEGTAAGRDLWAWCEGMRRLGHQLDAWVWYVSASSPRGPVPDWCRVEPFNAGPRWRRHLRAVTRPRQEVAAAGWSPSPGAVAVADHLWSAAAVAPFERSVATLHFRALADARAVGRRPAAADLQMARAERRAGRRSGLVLAYSERVARGLGAPVATVPIAYPAPPGALSPNESPVAALLADWSWPPNRVALGWLLGAWPAVRRAMPGARLLLAGRNLPTDAVGPLAGVEVRGPVAASADVLAEAAVVAFPCPPSSGPKVKVLEALAHGLPVVTTPAGVEGVHGAGPDHAPGAVVTSRARFATELAALLSSAERRAALGAAGRAAVLAGHSAERSARARLSAIAAAFGPAGTGNGRAA